MAGCKLAGCCWIAKIGKGKHKEEETNYIIVRRRRRTEGVRVKGRDTRVWLGVCHEWQLGNMKRISKLPALFVSASGSNAPKSSESKKTRQKGRLK